ncbi:MAG TPA: carboxypeptidase-like regulatory domain-containing protein [Candidatus Acidoferrales bacterium]|nr:carboxypeptidase-like regulatory domain-containing protein [Candidatus Acidoferrales bacterium]
MKRIYVNLGAVLGVALAFSMPAWSQNDRAPARTATIIGTATDVNGDTIPNGTVVLKEVDSDDPRTIVTTENGLFEFHDVKPGIAYQLNISAKGFAEWASPPITLSPGQFKIVTGIQLRIAMEATRVDVHYDRIEVATEQLKVEEKQRVFGIIPNFYVSYESDPVPLTAGMKFKLALKVSTDPVTAAGALLVAAARQAGNSLNYGQGWGAYGQRFGATAADGFSDIIIGGAILPSLLHQDPRYFYQGTGTTSSRIRHAMFSPFVAKGDNGKWQPNYSSLGGDLASSALSNLYYPQSNRGAGLVFTNFAIGTAERIGASLAQEFLVGKFTRRGGHMK